ncbi:MAG: DUF3990 domain-containing protein [Lachnospiraceae bacterium]|nr:DUF3990 domain-containing protein [Lachnospiraceae bacterium]
MDHLILYHGSPVIIEKPEFGKGKANNDYGRGFYCTEHIELAKEWSCSLNTNGYANKYEIDTQDLRILHLSDGEYTILNWLAILIQNRQARLSTPVARRGKEWLIQYFLPEYTDYDVIVGYRADDSYFSFARSFLSNEISLSQLGRAMKLGKLGEQYVLKSKKAFDAITYMDSSPADNRIYYEKRVTRDKEARAAYYRELETDDLNGIFMRDIIREEMKPDDPRLR